MLLLRLQDHLAAVAAAIVYAWAPVVETRDHGCVLHPACCCLLELVVVLLLPLLPLPSPAGLYRHLFLLRLLLLLHVLLWLWLAQVLLIARG